MLADLSDTQADRHSSHRKVIFTFLSFVYIVFFVFIVVFFLVSGFHSEYYIIFLCDTQGGILIFFCFVIFFCPTEPDISLALLV